MIHPMRLKTKIRLWCLAHLLIVLSVCSTCVLLSQKNCGNILSKKVEASLNESSTTNELYQALENQALENQALEWFRNSNVFIWDDWKLRCDM